MHAILEPFSHGPLQLKNRVVMAPMTRSMSPFHIPGENVARYYARRAEGGVGLIITEGTIIGHRAANGYPDVPAMAGEAPLAGWKRVVDEVHQAGGKIFPQLWHVGTIRQRSTHENLGADNPRHIAQCDHPEVGGMGPSAIAHPYIENAEVPHEMTKKEIEEVVQAFVDAALSAKEIGFDGIELHGAHGYLIDQFFWDVTNKRQDEYGGKTLAERTRFATELIGAVRDAVGPDFPIGMRISQWKLGDYSAKMAKSPQELEAFLTPLAEAGLDLLHCSTRRFWDPEFPDSPLNFASWAKKITGLPTITVGSVGLNIDFVDAVMGDGVGHVSEKHLTQLAHSLEKGEFDLVAVGRSLLADPQWIEKVSEGRFQEIRPFGKELLSTLE